MDTTALVQAQRPLISQVQVKIGDLNAQLLHAEHELTKTAEYKRIQELRTTLVGFQKQEQEIRDGIKQSMIAGHVKSLETLTHKFTIKNNPWSVVIVDEQVIPSEYKKEKITVSIDKTAIKNDIKDGNDIMGAYIQYSQTLLITPK